MSAPAVLSHSRTCESDQRLMFWCGSQSPFGHRFGRRAPWSACRDGRAHRSVSAPRSRAWRNWCKYFQTELEQIELKNIANDHNQGRSAMLSRRTVLDLLACSALATAAGAEPA